MSDENLFNKIPAVQRTQPITMVKFLGHYSSLTLSKPTTKTSLLSFYFEEKLISLYFFLLQHLWRGWCKWRRGPGLPSWLPRAPPSSPSTSLRQEKRHIWSVKRTVSPAQEIYMQGTIERNLSTILPSRQSAL